MSDKITWTNITRDNVLDAIEFFDNEHPYYMNPKGLYLIYNNKKYPAKTIRKLAYNIKNDAYINEDRFKGGSYTVKFFNNLGFDVEYNNQQFYVNTKTPKITTNNKNRNKKNSIKPKKQSVNEKVSIFTTRVLEQKNALQLILNDIFHGDLVVEKSYEWMRTPIEPKRTYPELFNAIKDYRGYDNFARSNYLLQCDFVSESNKVIIEYDERQHFTLARKESLSGYPDIELNFDKDLWIKASEDIRAVDNTPKDRDETRAYYDSIRDIEAYNHGYKLIRIMHDEYDFEEEGAYEYVEQLIRTYVPTINTNPDLNKILKGENVPDKIRMSAKYQKNVLQLLLNKLCDNDVICEKPYDWMKTPKNPKKYAKIYNSLVKYNGGNISAKNNYRLHCDFVCESKKLIIEYDERAHFTEAREISLQNYPEIKLNFDKNHWIESCHEIKAKTDSKHNSSANRAYYDSIRDIEAYNHGYKLIRIKDGEFDFTREDAYDYLDNLINGKSNIKSINKSKHNYNKSTIKKGSKNMLNKTLLSNKKNMNLKLGLYLQTDDYKNSHDFKSKMKEIKKQDFDILVFPEFCYTSFSDKVSFMDIFDDDDWEYVKEECLNLSKELNKAVVVSLFDCVETYFSVYANDNAEGEETLLALYYKNTMTGFSLLETDDYDDVSALDTFPIIDYKGYKLGLTICNDGNHAPFSRMYGLQDVDLLLNSSGGEVKYKKWYTYHKTRSIENNCFSLVTMGSGSDFKNKSYTFGFNPNGGYILPENLHEDEEVPSTEGEVYIYDLSDCDMSPKPDKYLEQKETINKFKTYQIPQGNISSILNKAKSVKDNVYKIKKGENNIIFILIDEYDILKPELVIPYLYDKKLSRLKNKKYIIVNKFEGELDEKFYENHLSVLLKARTTENYVTVILESDNINKCYQPTNNHDAQIVQAEDGIYNIDIKRASGPEAIWTTKRLMKKEWRKGFEILIDKMVELS